MEGTDRDLVSQQWAIPAFSKSDKPATIESDKPTAKDDAPASKESDKPSALVQKAVKSTSEFTLNQ